MDDISPRTRGLKAYLEEAAKSVRARPSPTAENQDDGAVLYFGNWQDAHPRALLYDPVLDPRDKLAWMVVKAASDPKAPTAFPSYADFEAAGIGSRPTISVALAMLRIQRWVSLCHRVRDDRGRYRGNVYALHDEPVSLAEAMYLDDQYMEFLQQMQEHHSRRVRDAARNALAAMDHGLQAGEDVTADPHFADRWGARLGRLRRRADQDGSTPAEPESATSANRVQSLNPDADHRVKQFNSGSDSQVKQFNSDEKAQKSDTSHQVKKFNPSRARGSSSNYFPTTTTTEPKGDDSPAPASSEAEWSADDLRYPESFSANHRHLGARCLNGLPADVAQQVLDELDGCIRNRAGGHDPIRNPISYLQSLARKAKSGEFIPSYATEAAEKRRREEEAAARQAELDRLSEERALQELGLAGRTEAQAEPAADAPPSPSEENGGGNELVERLNLLRKRK